MNYNIEIINYIFLTCVVDEEFHEMVEVSSVADEFSRMIVQRHTDIPWVPYNIHYLQ